MLTELFEFLPNHFSDCATDANINFIKNQSWGIFAVTADD
jgi:hypothetical protein